MECLKHLTPWSLRSTVACSNERAMLQIADKYAHRMAMLLECIVMSVPSGTAYWDEAMEALAGYRSEMNAIHEQESPTHMGEPVLRNNVKLSGRPAWAWTKRGAAVGAPLERMVRPLVPKRE